VLTIVLGALSAHLGVFTAVLTFGLLVGILGHISKSRTLVLVGILIIGATSAYFLATGENAANCSGICL
jgi:hypothetical protein